LIWVPCFYSWTFSYFELSEGRPGAKYVQFKERPMLKVLDGNYNNEDDGDNDAYSNLKMLTHFKVRGS